MFTTIALIPNNPTKLVTIQFLNFEWLKKNEIRSEDVKVKTREDTVALSNRLDVFEDRQQSTVITIKWNILLAQRLIPPLPHQKGMGFRTRRQKQRIYLFKSRLLHDNYSLFRNNFILLSLFISPLLVPKRKKRKNYVNKGKRKKLSFRLPFFFSPLLPPELLISPVSFSFMNFLP